MAFIDQIKNILSPPTPSTTPIAAPVSRSWQDDLRPASFRGVPFKVDSSQYTAGRRVTFHEFVNRDIPYPEDLGKVGETFKLEAYLIGDDVAAQKRKLIAACNQYGPGELVHPYYGTLQVQCGPISVDDNKNDGRICRISIQFYDAGDNRFPNDVNDKQDKIDEVKAAGLAAAAKNFEKKFSIFGLPNFAVESARSMVAQAADAFENATKGLAQSADQISDLAFNIRNLRAEVNDLIQAPGQLATRLQDSMNLLLGAFGGNKDATKATLALMGFVSDIGAAPFDTPSRQKEAENHKAFDDLMRQSATINAVAVSGETAFSSTDEITIVRDQISDSIELVQLSADDDDVYQSFQDLKAQLVRVLPDTDNELPNVQNYTPLASTNSVALSYDLFEHLDGEQDLIDRNKIKNPAFIYGGVELEVLNVRAGA